jgi:nicotinamide-nucleotide amidase
MNEPILPVVLALADALRARGWRLATAESCTGGLIAAACTALAGSSDWFERGVVSYSNAAKTELLGVPAALIAAHGAVSEPVARAMAEGVLARSGADLAVAVTGIAGPGGAVPGKPVGTVWLGWGRPGAVHTECLHLPGDRGAVRQATVAAALERALAQARAAAAPASPPSIAPSGDAPASTPERTPPDTPGSISGSTSGSTPGGAA